jgi:hypothetical protein
LVVLGFIFAILVGVMLPTTADAQDDEDRPVRGIRDTKWDFFVAPYGWLTGVAGTVVTNGDETDLDVPFEVFAENTRAGFQLYFEARRGKMFLAFDGTRATLGGEIEGNILDIDIEVRQRIYDIRAGYEVHNT